MPYTVEQLQQWAAQQPGGRQLTQDELNQLAGQVGAPGTGGYSDQQWQQAQTAALPMLTAANPNAEPFFPTFTPPTYEAPDPYQPPQPFSYGDFSYDAFKPPTLADAESEPGYQSSLKAGMGMLQNSAAARGVVRTGGSLKELMDYGIDAGQRNYQNVYDRSAKTYDRNRAGAFSQWGANRDNAAQAYATNYDVARNAWMDNANLGLQAHDRTYTGARDAFNARFRDREMTFEDLYRRWNTQVDANTRLATMPLDF